MIRDERESLPQDVRGVELLLGERCYEKGTEDVIFLSPSVRRERECVKNMLSTNAVISSDAELFFEENKSLVLAVSGSDGKSTTCALTGEILSSFGTKNFVCANFGLPMTPLLNESDAVFVTELSSFMLRYMKPHSRRALITNVTPNHLNWHDDFEEYKQAKENLILNAQEAIFSFDCDICKDFAKKHGAFAVFSVTTPFSELKKLIKAENYYTIDDGFLSRNGNRILHRTELRIPGIHNVKNALAAMSLTDGFCDTGAMVRALKSFCGLSHRCKLVANIGGLRFFNSSIDSTPERTSATLEIFENPVTVILGGRDKGLDYAPLENALKKHAGAVILCGENEKRLAEFISKSSVRVPIYFARDFCDATKIALDIGLDAVLSPASTSFDRFKNFEHRGEVFEDAVKNIEK